MLRLHLGLHTVEAVTPHHFLRIRSFLNPHRLRMRKRHQKNRLSNSNRSNHPRADIAAEKPRVAPIVDPTHISLASTLVTTLRPSRSGSGKHRGLLIVKRSGTHVSSGEE